MATASEDHCPICLDTWDNAACTMPCLHRFCFSCIRRWAETKPECPLCRRRVTSIRHSLRGDEFEEFPIRPPVASLGSGQGEGPYRLPAPTAPRVHRPWNPDPGFVGSLQPRTWGLLFWERPDLLQLLQPWLRRELGRIFGEERPQALMLEHMILSDLPLLGLHEEHLVELLRANLRSRTTAFVQGLIEFTVERCGRVALHLLDREDFRVARGLEDSTGGSAVFMRWRERSPVASASWAAYQERQEGNLMASTGPSASRGGSPAPGPPPSSSAAADALPGSSTAALQGRPGCPLPVPAPIPGEQEELHQQPGPAVAHASAPSQGRVLLTSGAPGPSEEEGQQLRGACRALQGATPPVPLEEGPSSWRKEGQASSTAMR